MTIEIPKHVSFVRTSSMNELPKFCFSSFFHFLMEDYAKFHNDGGVHIEDEVIHETEIDNSNDPTHISLQDVMDLIEKPEEGNEVSDYLMKHNTFIMEHKVKRVNKYINEIRSFWEDATPMEMIIAFDESHGDIDELTINLIQEGFKDRVKEIVKRRLKHDYSSANLPSFKKSAQDNDRNYQPPNQDEDDEEDKTDEDYQDYSYYRVEERESRPYKKHTKSNPISHSGVIPPCPSNITQEEWLSWSDARRNSYLRGMEYPNSYFYRHLPPGEVQKNGSWSPQEKAAFMKRLAEFRGNSTTMNGDWGLFSRTIPGRVGYQCANFYRKLVESGEVYDSNYVKGEEGKIHHKSRIHDGKIIVKTHSASSSVDGEAPPRQRKHKNKIVEPDRIRSLRLVFSAMKEPQEQVIHHFVPIIPMHQVPAQENDDHDTASSEENTLSRSNSGNLSRYETWALQNPLPDMLDDITGEKIRVPTISPDGYVLDYNTWMNALKTNKENPFTRAPVTRRQLVILTKDNIDEYRDKIVNHNTGEQEEKI